eukprot:4663210-Pleurochrysis_carterae.AAC.1
MFHYLPCLNQACKPESCARAHASTSRAHAGVNHAHGDALRDFGRSNMCRVAAQHRRCRRKRPGRGAQSQSHSHLAQHGRKQVHVACSHASTLLALAGVNHAHAHGDALRDWSLEHV